MTDKSPVVSVIMIFLNAEQFIAEAIESVFAQTYTEWELLLVDDASTDASSRIARGYAEAHPGRVRYLQHAGGENRGMSASRNLGLQEARGRYVAFLDADDLYLPEKLSRQTGILEEHPTAAMVYGPTLMWYTWRSDGPGRIRDMLRPLGVPPDTLIPPPSLLPLFLLRRAYTPGTCGVLVRRDAAIAVGGFDEAFRGMYEDQVFFYKICYASPVYVDGVCGDLYRQNPESHSSRMRSNGSYRVYGPNPAYHKFLEWLERFLVENGCSDEPTWHALAKELRPYRSRFHYAFYLAVQPAEKIRRALRQWRARKLTDASPWLPRTG